MLQYFWQKENMFLWVFFLGGIAGIVWSFLRRIGVIEEKGVAELIENDKDIWCSLLLLLFGIISIILLKI